MKKTISGITVLSFLFFSSCSLSSNAKRMMASVGIGCAAGLAAGAVYDESQRKKESKNKENNFQKQVKATLLMEKAKPQNKGKIVGLGTGCLAGVGVGYYLNTMYDSMEEEMSKEGINLKKIPNKQGETEAILVQMDGGISFEDGKADLKGKGKENIDKLAEALGAYPETKISITGHANKTGPEDKNLSLSESRATEAKEALLEAGLPKERIQEVKGLGSSKPAEGLKPEEGANRRVEVLILPKA